MNTTIPYLLKTTLTLSTFVKTITFSWYDYVLFSGMLSLSALIGIYFGCFGSKQSTADEYLMGGKKMGVIPIAVSLTASHISGLTLMAVPADVYRFGASYALIVPSLIIVSFGIVYIYLPVFFKMQCTSTFEYLNKRFDYKCRMLGSFLFALTMLVYLPIVVYIPALAFSAATGVSVHVVTPIVCGVCIFYTTLGGLKAVVWTDTLQFTVTLGALGAVFILGIRAGGGFTAIVEKAYEYHRLDLFDFDLDPTKRDTFWVNLIGMCFMWSGFTSVNQSCVQKFLSVSTMKEAKITVILFAIGLSVVTLISIFTGLIMFSKYYSCDPLSIGVIKKPDQLLPYYVMDVANSIPGLPGLFIAGIFCAGLSTLSAHLNCLSGTLYEDFVSKILTNPSEATVSLILKALVVISGVICTAMVYIVDKFEGIMALAFTAVGITNGPLLALFTLGMLFPNINSNGMFYGTIVSIIVCSWISFMNLYYQQKGLISYPTKPLSTDGCGLHSNLTNAFKSATTSVPVILNSTTVSDTDIDQPFILFRVSFYYYTLIGLLVCLFAALVISYCTKKSSTHPVNRDLFSPLIYGLIPEDRNANTNQVEYFSVNKALHIVTLNTENK